MNDINRLSGWFVSFPREHGIRGSENVAIPAAEEEIKQDERIPQGYP
jgi:hypothetical protein